MSHNDNPFEPTRDCGGRAVCPECNRIYAALGKHDIAYEVVAACNWCRLSPADTDPEMEGCCSEDCRYMLARDEGFVSDAEHEQFVAEGWAPTA